MCINSKNQKSEMSTNINSHAPVADASGSLVKSRFADFIRNCCFSSDGDAAQEKLMSDYMLQLSVMTRNGKTTLYVDFQHILQFDHELAEAIELEFYRFEPYLRATIQELIVELSEQQMTPAIRGIAKEYFVSIYNLLRVERIRAMRTEKVGRLIAISGTVTRSSEVRPELLYGNFICSECGVIQAGVEQQFQFTEPYVCRTPNCGKNRYQLLRDQSTFVDWQRLRVQENADEIPAGSMPRCLDVICRNEVVEMAKAGDKIVFTGTIAVIPDTSGLSRVGEQVTAGKQTGRGDNFGDGVRGLKKLGVRDMNYRMLFIANSVQHTDQRTGCPSGVPLTAELVGDNESAAESNLVLTDAEKMEILAMRNSAHLYKNMADSICPAVFGHMEVKRGILLMLFGGVHKHTSENISLRGDINVCIVGDPSCAKSQFLKYVHGFLPRTVYTSGKSSSAAGLTASVVRDAETGEFCVEAGALMLADNGICCIDEFDKMDPSDQVAIHEAMEQQTISITKAGIQATLNARTSILAAANPVFGRYDRSKPLKSNVTISAPIMSRFDLFFVILDECNPAIDDLIARHIVEVHRDSGKKKVIQSVPFSSEQLQRYIRFARTLNPMITQESRDTLVQCYRELRNNDIVGKNKTAYRITVRQLESLIRLSEALARLHLDDLVQPVYVREAFRLLQKSIIFVENEDIQLEDNEEEMDQLERSQLDTDGEDVDEEGANVEMNAENEAEEGLDDYDRKESYLAKSSPKKKRSSSTMEAEGDDLSSPSPQPHQIERLTEKLDKGKGKEDPTLVEGATEATMSVTVKPEKTKKEKQPLRITAKEYEDATQMLALYLKTLEDQDPDFTGISKTDLIGWYLRQFQAELVGLEAFELKQKIVTNVIKRMIKHDGVLIEMKPTDSTSSSLIKLHPSYDP